MYIVDCLFEEVRALVLDHMTLLDLSTPVPARSKCTGEPEDLPVDTILREVHQAICNYCNINTVPGALKYVWANMAVDYWRYILATAKQNAPVAEGGNAPTLVGGHMKVTAIREGDTQINVTTANALSASETAAVGGHDLSRVLDQVTLNYIDQLNRFRKVVW